MSATRTISEHLRIHSTIANTMLKAWETGKWGNKTTQNIIQWFKDESFKDDGSKKSHIVIVQLNSGHSIYNLHNFHAHRSINESLCPVDHLKILEVTTPIRFVSVTDALVSTLLY